MYIWFVVFFYTESFSWIFLLIFFTIQWHGCIIALCILNQIPENIIHICWWIQKNYMYCNISLKNNSSNKINWLLVFFFCYNVLRGCWLPLVAGLKVTEFLRLFYSDAYTYFPLLWHCTSTICRTWNQYVVFIINELDTG